MMKLILVTVGTLCMIQDSMSLSVLTKIPIVMDSNNPSRLNYEQFDRFTDPFKRLTAVKDKKRSSCFIRDYDPQWNPDDSDREELIHSLGYETVDTPEDEYKLKKKAGIVISEMCKPVRIYWATLPPPPPMLISGSDGNAVAPPPAMLNPENIKTPPPLTGVEEYDRIPIEIQEIRNEHIGNEILLEPPALSSNQDNGWLSNDIKTPPPLEIYRQQHQQFNERSNHLPMIEPPTMDHPGNPMIELPVRDDSRSPRMEPLIRIPPPLHPSGPLEPHGNPPTFETEKKEEIMVPPPLMIRPETETEKDDVRTPPPLNIWRQMMAVAKEGSTLAPPPLDMK